jgi:hypothetical protein
MEILGMILCFIGVIGSLVGGVWFLIIAFQENILWGLGCLIVPLVSLVFLILHFDKVWQPFLVQLASGAITVLGLMLIGPELEEAGLSQNLLPFIAGIYR